MSRVIEALQVIKTADRYIPIIESIESSLHLQIDSSTFCKGIDQFTRQFTEFCLTFLEMRELVIHLWGYRNELIRLMGEEYMIHNPNRRFFNDFG